MNQDLKNVTLQFNCQENYNAMSNCQDGKHCAKCNNTVVDFTNASQQQFDNYVNKNKGKQICGKFQLSQMSKTYIKSQMASAIFTFAALSFCNKEYVFARPPHNVEKPPRAIIGMLLCVNRNSTIYTPKTTSFAIVKDKPTQEAAIKEAIIKLLQPNYNLHNYTKTYIVKFQLKFSAKGKVMLFKAIKGKKDIIKLVRKKVLYKKFKEVDKAQYITIELPMYKL